ncbi:MAG: Putative hydrolase [candidate division WS6 bacterium 34_10]|jgi:8-oxo-dGTP pyrophosphatase MutT (NUDIX family)|uniref:Putative hydrolase n=1 Tax=candidate division WS6 bacterium 34_10 TaxID=1641389 RepID=A0A101HJ11_9BACT|nr:MAG: Putative hydrolase [candidate division WS6 bacterium 34_10]
MTTVRIGDTSSLEKKRIVNTSGGCYLVRKVDNNFELLVIHKKWPDGKEHYVLPKGHKEGDEYLEETAKRETIEESGYTDFKLLKYIGSCTYELDWKEIQLKTDHYYLAILQSEEQRDRKPEEYEKVVTVKNIWVDLEEGFKLLTFENQEEIHDKIRELIPN